MTTARKIEKLAWTTPVLKRLPVNHESVLAMIAAQDSAGVRNKKIASR